MRVRDTTLSLGVRDTEPQLFVKESDAVVGTLVRDNGKSMELWWSNVAHCVRDAVEVLDVRDNGILPEVGGCLKELDIRLELCVRDTIEELKLCVSEIVVALDVRDVDVATLDLTDKESDLVVSEPNAGLDARHNAVVSLGVSEPEVVGVTQD
uniref:Uncharacterized protein n=1 Tax=Cacopsylla melanoneura TaxID=428564 RepID=A0A8D8QG87_9HEMI